MKIAVSQCQSSLPAEASTSSLLFSQCCCYTVYSISNNNPIPKVFLWNRGGLVNGPQSTVQHTMSTKLPLLYSMFGLAGTGGAGGPFCLVYTALFCYQIMTLKDQIVHYIFLLLFGSVLKLAYLSSEVEKK